MRNCIELTIYHELTPNGHDENEPIVSNLIYTAADGNYSLQAEVLLLSLARTQKSRTRLLVLGNGWTAGELNRISQLQTELVSVEVREVESEKFQSVRLANKFPLATAYNILAPLYELRAENRALYVDADVVITEDLGHLWSMTMTTPVAAVLDAHIGWVSSPSMWRPWREELMEPMTPYLNTGVMLINVPVWNQLRMTEQILEMLGKYQLPCVDQDAINIVLRGNFDQLEPRYNLMPYHYMWKFRYVDAVESDLAIGKAITNPAIIHFHRSFLGKPWTYGAIHPATKLWRNLANDAHPRWRKSFDLMGLARRRAAKFAKMLEIDSRTREISQL